jgi:hypothetical protein
VRRLIWVVVVLLVLAIGADRVGAVLAAHVVASKLTTSASLTTEPSVTIHGFPFLTQAISGRYDDVELVATDLARGGVRLAKLDVSLHGVRLPLSDAISGQVSSVPVEGITAKAVVSYADIASRGNITGLSVQPAGSLVKVTGRFTVLGQSVTASTESTVRISGRTLVVVAEAHRPGAVQQRPEQGPRWSAGPPGADRCAAVRPPADGGARHGRRCRPGRAFWRHRAAGPRLSPPGEGLAWAGRC